MMSFSSSPTRYRFIEPRGPASTVGCWKSLPENRLVINSQDAAKLKVVQGASVSIETTDGKAHLQCKAQIVPGIRPGVVALAKGFGYREAGVARQIVDGTAISADKTRGAGANSSVLTLGKAPARVKVRPV